MPGEILFVGERLTSPESKLVYTKIHSHSKLRVSRIGSGSRAYYTLKEE